MIGVEGELVALQSLLTIEKETRTSDFKSIESPPNLIPPPFPYKN